MSRRVLSVLLSVILIITMMPFTSYAASTSKSIFSAVEKGKSVSPKHILTVILWMDLLFIMVWMYPNIRVKSTGQRPRNPALNLQ